MGDEKDASHTVAIEGVEVTRAEGPADPAAREALERLLSRWLVRAYLRRYAGGHGDETEGAVA